MTRKLLKKFDQNFFKLSNNNSKRKLGHEEYAYGEPYGENSILASLREGGGIAALYAMTEGACVHFNDCSFYVHALSLTQLRRELPPGGSLWSCENRTLSALT